MYKAWLEKEREDKEKALLKIKIQPPSTTKLGQTLTKNNFNETTTGDIQALPKEAIDSEKQMK